MKLTFLWVLLALAPLAGADQSGSQVDDNPVKEKTEKNGESVLRTNSAVKAYREEYLLAPDNKAFAQSTSGHWSWHSDRVNIEMAKEDALAGCNKYVKPKEPACVIVNVNGEWTTPQ